MKQVVIGMKNGKPYVIHAPKGVSVVFRKRKRRTLRKTLRTWWYHISKSA